MAETPQARIGMVNFINTAALYEVWKETVHRPHWQVVEATPAELNRRLAAGALDLGFVSSLEYAEHPERYRLLADLSISSTGAVGSVFLFSELRVEALSDQLLCLSPQSKTSNALIKIILEEFYGVRPRYLPPTADGCQPDSRALVAIGDQALRLQQQGRFPICLDLGEVWQRHTGLPFVFAVWAVREEFCQGHGDCLEQIHRELVRCQRLGRGQLAAISQRVAPKVPMPASACLTYLEGIELDLDPNKVRGLELFYRQLIRRGEASAEALPLKIHQTAA